MASEKQVYIRISLKDGEVVKKALADLGKEGQHALMQIQEATEPASAGLKAINVISQEFHFKLQNLSEETGTFGKVLSALGPEGIAAAAGIGVVVAASVEGVKAFASFETASLKLEGVLNATGKSALISLGGMIALADEVAGKTFFPSNQILDAEAALLTFNNISSETFERAIKLGTDLTSVMGGDLQGNIEKIGKLLENPAANLDALRKVGVKFTEQQKDLIKSLQDSGKLLEAQNVILDIGAGKMRDVAEKTASGLAGQYSGLKNSIEEASIALGGFISEFGILQGTMSIGKHLSDATKDVFNALSADLIFAKEKFYEFTGNEVKAGIEADSLAKLADRLTGSLKNVGDAAARAGQQTGVLSDSAEDLKKKLGENLRNATKDADTVGMDAGAAKIYALHQVIEQNKNAYKELGAEGEKITAQIEQQYHLEDAKKQTLDAEKKATEDLARAEENLKSKLQDMLDQRIRDTQGLTSNLDKNNSELQQLLDKNVEAYKALGGEADNLIEKIKQQNILYAQQKQHVEEVKKAAEEYVKIADSIKETLASDFEQILKKGKLTWKSLGDSLIDAVTKAAAKAAAQMVFQPIIAPMVASAAGAISGGDVGGATAQKLGIGSNGFSSISSLSNLSSVASNFWNGATGGFSAINQFGSSYLGTGLPGLSGSLTSASLGTVMAGGGIGSMGASLVGLGNKNPLINAGAGMAGSLVASALLTPFLGPLAPIVGGFAGSAIAGLFGGGKKHPEASFSADITSAGLENVNYKSKHMSDDSVKQIAAQFGSYIQQLSSVGVDASGKKVSTVVTPNGGKFILDGKTFAFNPSNTNSVSGAFSDLFKEILQTAKITNDDLAKALHKVNTEGKSFAEVIAELNFQQNILPQLVKQAQTEVYNTQLQQSQSQIQLLEQQASAYQSAKEKWQNYADSLQQSLNELLLNQNLSILSPQDRLNQALSQYKDIVSRAPNDESALGQFTGVSNTLAQIARDYYGSSQGYVDIFDMIEADNQRLKDYSQSQVSIQNAMLLNAQTQLAEEQKQSDYLQQMIDKLSAGTKTGAWSQIPDAMLLRATDNPAILNTINSLNQIPERLSRQLKVLAGFDFTDPANVGISFAQAVKAGKANGNFFNQLLQEVGGKTQAFANGGLAAPGWALVGEKGPELVKFGSPAFVYNNSETRKLVSGANDNGILNEIQGLRRDFAGLIRIIAASGDVNKEGLEAIHDRLATIESKARLQAAA